MKWPKGITCLGPRQWSPPNPHAKWKRWWAQGAALQQREGAVAAPKTAGLRDTGCQRLESFNPLPLPTCPLRQATLCRCSLPWPLYGLSHTQCSPLHASSSWLGFSWLGFSLIWGKLPIHVASGLGDREPNSIF